MAYFLPWVHRNMLRVEPMKRTLAFVLCCFLLPLLGETGAMAATTHTAKKAKKPAANPAGADAEPITYGRFGTVYIYRKTPHPKNVVLFFSGDGGWNLGVVDMAHTLATMDALVVGISLPKYVKEMDAGKEACSYPAADLEMLSKYVQKKLGMPAYVPPVLVGYSSGATLVYAVLVEAPPNTFRGAISMGFCPDLPLTKPMCAGHGLSWGPGPKNKGYSFKPTTILEQPWVAFQGDIDQVCSPKDVVDYVKDVKNGTAIMLPKVGHGFSVPSHWEPQFKEAFNKLTAVPPAGAVVAAKPAAATPPGPGEATLKPVSDLPLVEIPSTTKGDLLAVILSGDGGWASIDKDVAQALSAKGIPVVGLDALQYFWTERTPKEMGADFERILRHYLAAWDRQQVLVIGYSLGADVMPFMASRLPPDLVARVKLMALLAPSRKASFQFHLSQWVGNDSGDTLVLPELTKLKGRPILCLYGEDEGEDSLCTEIGSLGRAVSFKGSHHFGGDYNALAERILHEMETHPGH
jgi:type IV secretory pathway VirJ component